MKILNYSERLTTKFFLFLNKVRSLKILKPNLEISHCYVSCLHTQEI